MLNSHEGACAFMSSPIINQCLTIPSIIWGKSSQKKREMELVLDVCWVGGLISQAILPITKNLYDSVICLCPQATTEKIPLENKEITIVAHKHSLL